MSTQWSPRSVLAILVFHYQQGLNRCTAEPWGRIFFASQVPFGTPRGQLFCPATPAHHPASVSPCPFIPALPPPLAQCNPTLRIMFTTHLCCTPPTPPVLHPGTVHLLSRSDLALSLLLWLHTGCSHGTELGFADVNTVPCPSSGHIEGLGDRQGMDWNDLLQRWYQGLLQVEGPPSPWWADHTAGQWLEPSEQCITSHSCPPGRPCVEQGTLCG